MKKQPSFPRKKAKSNGKLKQVNVAITNEMHEWLKERSAKTGIAMSHWMFFAIQEFINYDGLGEKRRQKDIDRINDTNQFS